MSALEMSWADLRDKILSAHKPISDQFFKGVGNKLQFKDSCIAERIMLNFADMNAPHSSTRQLYVTMDTDTGKWRNNAKSIL